MSLPSLADYLEPTAFVELYKDMEPKELGPDFGRLIEKKLFKPDIMMAAEIENTETFLVITDYNPAVKETLTRIIRGLRSVEREPIVIVLSQEMGLGKTHFLVLLWHLFVEMPRLWNELKRRPEYSSILEIFEELGYRPRLADKTIVMPIDVKDVVGKEDPYGYALKTVAQLIRRYRDTSPELTELAEFVESLVDKDALRAAEQLADELMDRRLGLLILVDEVYAGVLACLEEGAERPIKGLMRLMVFLTQLLDALKGKAPAVIVAASARQDVDAWEALASRYAGIKPKTLIELLKLDLIQSVKRFDERAWRRAEISLRETRAEDALRIVFKRLFKPRRSFDDAKKVIMEQLRSLLEQLKLNEDAINNYVRRLDKTFPFTPTYADFADKLMDRTGLRDLPRSQHIRDLIRITARLVSRIINYGNWDEITLLSPAHLKYDDLRHLLPESYARAWGGLYATALKAISDVVDKKTRHIAELMFMLVLMKSLTTNVMSLLDMIRRPEDIPRREILIRGTSDEDIACSLVGAVPVELLSKMHEAKEYLGKHTPYVTSITREGEEYLVLTFIPNPRKMVEALRTEEIAKLKNVAGEFDTDRLIEYFRSHLLEYGFEENMRKQIEKEGMDIKIVGVSTFLDERRAAEFLSGLKPDKFTMIVIDPCDVAEFLKDRSREECIRLVVNRVNQLLDKIRATNLFCIVVPTFDKSTLIDICTFVAEIKASNKVVEYIRSETERRLLIEKDPACRQLRSLLEAQKRPDLEEKINEIIVEAIEKMQKRIEEYASSMYVERVNSYASELCRAFNIIIFYKPEAEAITVDSLTLSPPGRVRDLPSVYGELPKVLVRYIRVKCRVHESGELQTHLIGYLEQYAIRHKEELQSGRMLRISEQFLIDALKRGWKNLPVKPLSEDAIKGAIDLLAGEYPVKDPEVKKVKISIEGPRGQRTIIIKRPIPPKPPRPKSEHVTVREQEREYMSITIREKDNVILGVRGLLGEEEIGQRVAKVTMSIRLRSGGQIQLTGLRPEELTMLFGDIDQLVALLSELRDFTSSMVLRADFITHMKEKELTKLVRKWNLKSGSYEFT